MKEPAPTRLDAVGTRGPVGKVSDEVPDLSGGKMIYMKPPREAGPAVTMNLRGYFNERKQMVLRQQYTVMGQVDGIATARGPLQFGKNGPVLATFHDGTLGFITEWPGLPAEHFPTGKLCRHCETKCDECNGTGKRVCPYPGCGGSGKILAMTKECPAAGCLKATGRYNPGCKKCLGCGMVPVPAKCPTCKGSGRAKCALCKASGKMSTGYRRGMRKRLGMPAPPICARCDGHGLERRHRHPNLAQFVTKRIPGTKCVGIGPITKICFHTVGDRSFQVRVIDVQPDAEGTPMFLLLESQLPGSMMHLMGGVPTLRSRQ